MTRPRLLSEGGKIGQARTFRADRRGPAISDKAITEAIGAKYYTTSLQSAVDACIKESSGEAGSESEDAAKSAAA